MHPQPGAPSIQAGRWLRCFQMEYPCCNGSGVILGAVLRPRIQKNSGGPVVSPSLSSFSPHGANEIERTDFPSKAKGRNVEPPSFEYTQCSKEGAKNDAPPARTASRRASSTPIARKRAPRMTPPNEQRPLGRRLGEGVFYAPVERRPARRPSGRRLERRRPRRLGAAPFRRRPRGECRGDGSPPSAKRLSMGARKTRSSGRLERRPLRVPSFEFALRSQEGAKNGAPPQTQPRNSFAVRRVRFAGWRDGCARRPHPPTVPPGDETYRSSRCPKPGN